MISIDTVYQRVLAILNKEQRGYLTPQEFNLFANQAQLEIFEQYFFDLGQFRRRKENNSEYSDLIKLTDEKLSVFKTSANLYYDVDHFHMPDNMHKLGTVIYQNMIEVEKTNNKDLLYLMSSPLAKPTNTTPVYIQQEANELGHWAITVYPRNIQSNISCTYMRKPNKVNWAYTNVNGNALYNASSSVDFEIHPSEESSLVTKILGYAGFVVKDPGVIQAADAKDSKKITQEKS